MTCWQRYPKYKPSGVEWLGEVPEGWEYHKLKKLVREKITDGPHETPQFRDLGYPFLSVDSIQDGKLVFENCRYISKEDHLRFLNKCKPEKNDILMGKAASIGKIAMIDVEFEFTTWSPLALIKPDNNKTNSKYLEYSLKSGYVQDEIYLLCTENTQKNISMGQIENIHIFHPPLPEQHAIAAFLDCETVRIDALIEKKERQIELLQEKRSALISHAVTKGLDPNAKMKDSGIEWLGMIPEGWEIISLKREWDVIDCKHITPEYTDDGIPIVSTTEVKPGRLSLENTRRTTEEGYRISIEGRCPKRGDIIYSRNASLGSAAFVDTDEVFCMGQDVCLITSLSNDQLFLSYQLNCPIVLNQIDSQMIGSTIKRINVEHIKNLIVTYPPLKEQNQIGSYLDDEIRKIDSTVGLIQRSIIIGNEYRSALISAAVTGKIDVRQEASA